MCLNHPEAMPPALPQNRSLVRKRLDAGEWRYVNEHRGVCVCGHCREAVHMGC